MVIYLQRRNELVLKSLIITLLLLFIVMSGYFSSFILFNNKDAVSFKAQELEIKTLKNDLQELGSLAKLEGDFIVGRVILRDIHNFYNEVVINLGSKDGVSEYDAVVNEEGLIGIIYKVSKDYSYVKLLTGDYNVSVKINETYGNLNKGKVSLLDKYSDIKSGDKIYTSGYSAVVKDIYVGEIDEVAYDDENLGKEVTVKLIDNNDLNYIAVIRGGL